jgi:tripartite-type tricarboxylate transporter receptor subunit TctC
MGRGPPVPTPAHDREHAMSFRILPSVTPYRLAIRSLLGAAIIFAIAAQGAEPIRIIVPVPAGGAADLVNRVLAAQISRVVGTTMIVENRPGANGIVGTEAVARAAPDARTLLATGTSFIVNPLLRKTNYDPLTSFVPVCELFASPTVLAVNSDSPFVTLADLLSAARAHPGQLTVAGYGPGSTAHLAFEQLKRDAKADMTFVPYPGTTPAFDAVLGQHVTAYFGESTFVRAQVAAGRVRTLATASPKRLEFLPDVPTLAELGFPGVLGDVWFAILAPADTPRETTERLAASYIAALREPDVEARLNELGLYRETRCGAEFARFLSDQLDRYGKIVRGAKITTR